MTPDIGQAAVDSLYNVMQIDEEWSVRDTRGYTWWAKDRAQRVTRDCRHGGWRVRRAHRDGEN